MGITYVKIEHIVVIRVGEVRLLRFISERLEGLVEIIVEIACIISGRGRDCVMQHVVLVSKTMYLDMKVTRRLHVEFCRSLDQVEPSCE